MLEDKLQIPQPSLALLRRRRLTDLLEQAAQHRVTVVSGPAGAGKTIACATWATVTPATRRVAWLTLDAEDGDPGRFWRYVGAALARTRTVPADALRSVADAPPEAFPLQLVEAAQLLTEPVVLVLDDVHEIADGAVLAGLDLLIRHAPPALRLILSGRCPPGLQLARLRVCGELADVRAADLACTPDEADAYLTMLGLEVDAAERDELLRRTEGWMAGMRLAAMRARAPVRGTGAAGRSGGTGRADGRADGTGRSDGNGRASGTSRAGGNGRVGGTSRAGGNGRPAGSGRPAGGARITDIAGDEPMVTDYLWDEVLGRQSAQARLFLLRTSITERVSAELADELTGEPGSAMMLERLSRESGFVEALGHEHAQYRYHPLLRDVLVAELHRQIPHEVPILLRRAARWHAAHGQPVESVRCAAQAGDWDYAAHVLAEAGVAALLQSGAAELEAVLALFPADRWADDAAVAAALAAVRLWHGDPDGARHHLDAARRGLGRCGEAASRVIEPWLAALRVMQAASQAGADPGLLAQGWNLAEQAQGSAGSLAEHRALGLLWFALGAARLRRWEIQDARYALDHADRQLAAGALAGLQMRSLGWQALADGWYGDLTRAAREADAVRDSSRADATARCLADLATAQVNLARDDLSAARLLLDRGDQQPAGQLPGEPAPGVVSALIRARVLLADGDTAGARGLVIRLRELHAAADPALDGVLNVLDGEIALRSGDTGRARILLALTEEGAYFDRADGRLAQGRLLLSDADYKGALEAVAPCLDGTADAMTLRDKVAALLVSTVAHRRLGLTDSAAEFLEQALALAEPDDAYRVFLDAGQPARSAITVLVPPTSRSAVFAGRILERFDTQMPRSDGPQAQAEVPLTDSELAVLRFLPSHMTNQEIAEALFLSINTVKTHLRSVYRKLGVGSRREAIARGRRLDLV